VFLVSVLSAIPIRSYRLFLFRCSRDHRDLHSFPTRRSSDLLSFRMQGVEFDNGDMYVDGHKAASDVRDEFVSVTEKKQPYGRQQIGRAVQQECRDRSRMPSSA